MELKVSFYLAVPSRGIVSSSAFRALVREKIKDAVTEVIDHAAQNDVKVTTSSIKLDITTSP